MVVSGYPLSTVSPRGAQYVGLAKYSSNTQTQNYLSTHNHLSNSSKNKRNHPHYLEKHKTFLDFTISSKTN